MCLMYVCLFPQRRAVPYPGDHPEPPNEPAPVQPAHGQARLQQQTGPQLPGKTIFWWNFFFFSTKLFLGDFFLLQMFKKFSFGKILFGEVSFCVNWRDKQTLHYIIDCTFIFSSKLCIIFGKWPYICLLLPLDTLIAQERTFILVFLQIYVYFSPRLLIGGNCHFVVLS